MVGTHAVPNEKSLDQLVIALLGLGAPKLFVWTVILVWFQQDAFPQVDGAFDLVEFFAGDASISKSAAYASLRSVRLDLNYGAELAGAHPRGRELKENPFDVTSDAGFAYLGVDESYNFSPQCLHDGFSKRLFENLEPNFFEHPELLQRNWSSPFSNFVETSQFCSKKLCSMVPKNKFL